METITEDQISSISKPKEESEMKLWIRRAKIAIRIIKCWYYNRKQWFWNSNVEVKEKGCIAITGYNSKRGTRRILLVKRLDHYDLDKQTLSMDTVFNGKLVLNNYSFPVVDRYESDGALRDKLRLLENHWNNYDDANRDLDDELRV